MKITQRMRVLRYLREVGPITPLDAIREFGIMRLAARIWELRKEGYKIVKQMVTSKNRWNEEVRFARYSLE